MQGNTISVITFESNGVEQNNHFLVVEYASGRSATPFSIPDVTPEKVPLAIPTQTAGTPGSSNNETSPYAAVISASSMPPGEQVSGSNWPGLCRSVFATTIWYASSVPQRSLLMPPPSANSVLSLFT